MARGLDGKLDSLVRDDLMRGFPFLLLVLLLSHGASAVSTRAQDQPTAPAANPDKPPQPPRDSPAQTPAPDGHQPQTPDKPVQKPHHVLTNDDLQGKGDMFGTASVDIDISNINECDRNCFESVRRGAPALADPAGQWKRDLLHGIDKATADAKWQGALNGLARAKGRFCQLDREKAEALANNANPRNVTEQELSIEEQYDQKYKAAQSDLNAAFGDADLVIRGYSGIVVSFMNLQKARISSAPCIQPQPSRYRPYQPPPDDPPGDPDDP
jgi:hypothetical protein